MTMNLLSSYSLLSQVHADQPEVMDLKPLIAPWTAQRLRRVDRYIELCVAGGLNCVGGRELPATTGVYLATRCGAVTTSARVMENIVSQGEMPKPLHFINTLGNSAGFYLTQLLRTTGNTLVISQEYLSFEAALVHACLDLESGRIPCALVGGIDEVALPLELHAQRLEQTTAQTFSEGSHWLLLEKNPSTNGVTLDAPQYFADVDGLAHWLAQQQPTILQCSFAPLPEETELMGRQASLTNFTWEGATHGVFSGAALIHLTDRIARDGERGVHLARAGDGSYCAVKVSRQGVMQAR